MSLINMKGRFLVLLLLSVLACSPNEQIKEEVVYLKKANGNFDLYQSDVLGQWEERLTQNVGYDWQPHWNEGLQKLVYYSNDSAESFTVLAMDIRSKKTDALPLAHLADYRLSANAEYIYYTTSDGDSKNIWRCDLDGNNRYQLTNTNGYNGRFSLSPDGLKMAFVSDRTGSNQLFVMNLGNGEVEQVSFFPLIAKYSTWSPDSKRLAVCLAEASDDPKWDIWLYNLPTQGLERFTNTPYSEQEIAWSLSGEKIAFHGTTENDGDQIYTLDVADGKFTKITSGDFYHGEPTWVPIR
ncbi:hypothetical protein [uncultured Roseivirga sp.]|uniref:TolB family protein n=1 Tax=uncultured Roseivirga sp. TaxID=543088 RepID=UPI00258F1075|nr:hypothetical protein [uncultured Roseivirga sp.]